MSSHFRRLRITPLKDAPLKKGPVSGFASLVSSTEDDSPTTEPDGIPEDDAPIMVRRASRDGDKRKDIWFL